MSTQPFPFVTQPDNAVSNSQSVFNVVGRELHRIFLHVVVY